MAAVSPPGRSPEFSPSGLRPLLSHVHRSVVAIALAFVTLVQETHMHFR
jgi:hypothetical protein